MPAPTVTPAVVTASATSGGAPGLPIAAPSAAALAPPAPIAPLPASRPAALALAPPAPIAPLPASVPQRPALAPPASSAEPPLPLLLPLPLALMTAPSVPDCASTLMAPSLQQRLASDFQAARQLCQSLEDEEAALKKKLTTTQAEVQAVCFEFFVFKSNLVFYGFCTHTYNKIILTLNNDSI